MRKKDQLPEKQGIRPVVSHGFWTDNRRDQSLNFKKRAFEY